MACVWAIQIFILLFIYTDLHKLVPKEKPPCPSSHSTKPLEDHHYDDIIRTDYDEDIYKEIGLEATDKKSINSAASSRSAINDPDDLMETAEDLMTNGRRKFRSLTPNSAIGSSRSVLNGAIGRRSASANGALGMEADYGTFDGSLALADESRSRSGSQEYIDSTEEGLVDYLEGKSKLRFIYHGKFASIMIFASCLLFVCEDCTLVSIQKVSRPVSYKSMSLKMTDTSGKRHADEWIKF